jgi:P27 family predicted phage terminase small subunit
MAMANRGRPKKPTSLKLLEGNPGKRPLPTDEVMPEPVADPCPKWFDRYAKQVWQELASRLEDIGLLTKVDSIDFQSLCISVGILRKAYQDLKKLKKLTFETDKGYRQQVPEIGIISSSIKTITTLAAKFGLSPADRVGLVSPKASEKQSEFEKTLSG